MLYFLVPRKVSTQCSAGKHIIAPLRVEAHGVKDSRLLSCVCFRLALCWKKRLSSILPLMLLPFTDAQEKKY